MFFKGRYFSSINTFILKRAFLCLLLNLFGCSGFQYVASSQSIEKPMTPYNYSLAFSKLEKLAPRKFLDVGDRRISFRDSGGKEDVVLFLHPFTGTADVWLKQFESISQQGYRVIAFSRRGSGFSGDLPRIDFDDSKDILALLEYFKLDRVHLVGAAAGGPKVLEFAVQNPTRVRSLTITNSMAGASPHYLAELRKSFMLPSSLDPSFKELSPSYRYENPTGVAEWIRIAGRSQAAKFSRIPVSERDARYLSMFGNSPGPKEIKAITAPVFLIYGGADMYAPPPFGKKIRELFPEAKFQVIPNVGHAAHWETPDEYNDALVEFWGCVEASEKSSLRCF